MESRGSASSGHGTVGGAAGHGSDLATVAALNWKPSPSEEHLVEMRDPDAVAFGMLEDTSEILELGVSGTMCARASIKASRGLARVSRLASP